MSDLTSYSVLEGVFGSGVHGEVHSQELRAFITPEGALNQKVSWSSDNPDVAFVDGEGLVVSVKAAGQVGEANITVTTKDRGKTASCKVSVDLADLFAPSDIMVGTLGVDALPGPIFCGGVYAGNGKVLAMPYGGNSPRLTLFDVNNCTTTFLSPVLDTNNLYCGGVYVGNNRVIAVPKSTGQVMLIDLNDMSATPFGSSFGSSARVSEEQCTGGVYAGNGKVVVFPHNAYQFKLIDVNNLSVIPFGPSAQFNRKYGSGVYVGNGKIVAVPFDYTQFALVDANSLSVSLFGPTMSVAYKFYGAVYVGNGRVLAIPYSYSQFALVDTNDLSVTFFGPVDSKPYKYAGGVYIGGGKVIAIPCGAIQAALVDINELSVIPVGGQLATVNKYYGGVYIGNGRIVTFANNVSQPGLIDLGSAFRPAVELSEEALLSAWFNKF